MAITVSIVNVDDPKEFEIIIYDTDSDEKVATFCTKEDIYFELQGNGADRIRAALEK